MVVNASGEFLALVSFFDRRNHDKSFRKVSLMGQGVKTKLYFGAEHDKSFLQEHQSLSLIPLFELLNSMSRCASDLFISLANWSRVEAPKFEISSLYVCTSESNELPKNVAGVVFAGSMCGQIARFYIFKDNNCMPISLSFGHSSKIVDFSSCKIPLFQNTISSLSWDGTVCLWNINDGICVKRYENLLPNGCQKIAMSKTAIEIAVVSGAFTPIYVINVHTGVITQAIRPTSRFVVGLEFYASADSEWLFAMDHNGLASYTSLTPSTATSHKMRIVRPEHKILAALPSPDFMYLLVVYSSSWSIVDICFEHWPMTTQKTESPILRACWLTERNIGIVEMDGTFSYWEVPPTRSPHIHADLLKRMTKEHDVIKSSLETACSMTGQTKVDLAKIREDKESILDPFLSSDEDKKKKTMSSRGSETFDPNEGEEEAAKPILRGHANATLNMPCIAGWDGKPLLGYDDSICIIANDYAEYSLSSGFAHQDRNTAVTAQCLIYNGDEILGLAEGLRNGQIIIRWLRNDKYLAKVKNWKHAVFQKKGHKANHPKVLNVNTNHCGKVVALFATKRYLFSSGKDCMVHVFSLPDFALLTTISIFTAPVISFWPGTLGPDWHGPKTKHVEKNIYLVTKDHVVAVINKNIGKYCNDREHHSVHHIKRIMAGHDGPVRNIWQSIQAHLLIIECNSLYIWSLLTSNLEAILTGQKKAEFLQGIGKRFVKLGPEQKYKTGVMNWSMRLGSLNFQIPVINVQKLALATRRMFQEHMNDPLSSFLDQVKNLPIIEEVLSEKTRHFFKRQGRYKYKTRFDLEFVGSSMIPTIYVPASRMGRKNHWQISSLVSAMILGTRISLSVGMRFHPSMIEYWKAIFHLNLWEQVESLEDYQRPSLFHLFTYVFGIQDEVHEVLFMLVSRYPEAVRYEWMEKIRKASSVFATLHSTMMLVWCTLATTLISSPQLSRDTVQTVVKYLSSVMTSEEIGAFVRELLARGIDVYKDYMTPELTQKVILAIAQNINADNACDAYSLGVFFKKRLEQFVEAAKDAIKSEKHELIAAFLDEISRQLSGVSGPDSANIETLLLLLLRGFCKLTKESASSIMKKVDISLPWFSYNETSRDVIYGNSRGEVRAVIGRPNSVLWTPALKICDTKIERVDLDPSGRMALVVSDEGKRVDFVRVQVDIKEDKETAELVESLGKTFSDGPPQIQWVSVTVVEFTGADGKVKRLDWPPVKWQIDGK